MVNVKSLMVGDWVLHNGTPKKVITNLADSVALEDTDNGYGLTYERVRNEQMEPIPLTDEILAKNGFRRKRDFMQLGNFDKPRLILWHTEDNKILNHSKLECEIHHAKAGTHVHLQCEFVHELQHLLRLCKIEKDVVV